MKCLDLSLGHESCQFSLKNNYFVYKYIGALYLDSHLSICSPSLLLML